MKKKGLVIGLLSAFLGLGFASGAALASTASSENAVKADAGVDLTPTDTGSYTYSDGVYSGTGAMWGNVGTYNRITFDSRLDSMGDGNDGFNILVEMYFNGGGYTDLFWRGCTYQGNVVGAQNVTMRTQTGDGEIYKTMSELGSLVFGVGEWHSWEITFADNYLTVYVDGHLHIAVEASGAYLGTGVASTDIFVNQNIAFSTWGHLVSWKNIKLWNVAELPEMYNYGSYVRTYGAAEGSYVGGSIYDNSKPDVLSLTSMGTHHFANTVSFDAKMRTGECDFGFGIVFFTGSNGDFNNIIYCEYWCWGIFRIRNIVGGATVGEAWSTNWTGDQKTYLPSTDYMNVKCVADDGIAAIFVEGEPIVVLHDIPAVTGYHGLNRWGCDPVWKNLEFSETDITSDLVAFAGDFLTETAVCDATGADNNITSTIWEGLATGFAGIDADAQLLAAAIKVEADATYTDNVRKAIQRYNYIVGKYAARNDFIDRGITPGSLGGMANPLMSLTEENYAPIAIFSMLIVASIAGFAIVLSKKRRRLN